MTRGVSQVHHSPAFVLPGATKRYVTASDGYTWRFSVGHWPSSSEEDEAELGHDSGEPRAYEPGKKYRATHDVGVVGPRVTKNVEARAGRRPIRPLCTVVRRPRRT